MPKTIFFLFIVLLSSFLNAAVIIGNSELLTLGYANQVEAWLGEGTIGLTRIYAKQAGDTGNTFHSAVDLKGRTITLIEVTSHSKVIGGYNPQSWDSSVSYITASNTNAFIFNLTNSEVRYHSYGYSTYETYNSNYGPTFGNGHDLHVQNSLQSGYAYSYAYRSTTRTASPDLPNTGYSYSILGNGISGSGLVYGKIEVFTITNNPAVPEPGCYLLVSLACIGILAWRKK